MPAFSSAATTRRWPGGFRRGRRRQADTGGLASLLGSDINFGAAVLAKVADLHVGPELFGTTTASGSVDAFSRRSTSVELLLGGKYHTGGFVFGAAAGPGLTRGAGTPSYRVLASVGYATEAVEQRSKKASDGARDATTPSASGSARGSPSSVAHRPFASGADRDGDGVPDAEDRCPAVMGDPDAPAARRGCPLDRDSDGIADADDRCIDVPGVAAEDPTRNGCPPDSDGDGIIDAEDRCPTQSGARSDDPAKMGCPTAVRIAGTQIAITEQVNFATGDATIEASSFGLLKQVAKVLNDHPEIVRVAVDGHTDNVGQEQTNLALSRRRAVAVVRWLVENGVDERRLETRGFGPRRPIADNDTDEGRAKNRRVELTIIKRSERGAAAWRDGEVR